MRLALRHSSCIPKTQQKIEGTHGDEILATDINDCMLLFLQIYQMQPKFY